MSPVETPAYTARRQERWTAPVYFVRLATPGAIGSGAEYPFARVYATHDIGGIDGVPWLMSPSGNTQTVDLKHGTTTRGNFIFPVIDKGGEVTAQMSDPALPLVTRLVVGAFFIAQIQVTGTVSGYPTVGTLELISDDGNTIERIRYASRSGSTFFNCTRGVDGTIPVDWFAGRVVHNGEQIRAGTRVSFFAGYAGLLPGDFRQIGRFEILERTLRSDQITWEISCTDIQIQMDKEIYTTASPATPIKLKNHPITLALQIMMTTPSGTNSSPFAKGPMYDIGPASVQDGGIGIDWSLIDIASAEAIILQTFDLRFAFTITGSVRAFDFITKQLLFPMRVFLWINATGQISFRRILTQFTINDVADQLNESDIVNWFPYTAGDREIMNVVDISWDYQALAVEKEGDTPDYQWATRTITEATKSVKRYGRRLTNGTGQPLFWQGLRNKLGHQSFVDAYCRDVFARWADPSPVIQIQTQYRKHHIMLGDIVQIVHSRMPNLLTGLRGLAGELLQVIDVRPSFGTQGGMVLRLATVLHSSAQVGDVFSRTKVKTAGEEGVFTTVLVAPQNFVATQTDKGVVFGWVPVPGATGYEIRTGQVWDGAEVITRQTVGTTYVLKNVPKSTRTYRIRAYRGEPFSKTGSTTQTYGQESVAFVIVQAPDAFGWNLVDQQDHIATGAPGAKTNLVFVAAGGGQPARLESLVTSAIDVPIVTGPFGWNQLSLGLDGLAGGTVTPTTTVAPLSYQLETEDLGRPALTDVIVASDIRAVETDGWFDSLPDDWFGDHPEDWFDSLPAKMSTMMSIALSQDGVNYEPFKEFQNGAAYYARRIKFRVDMAPESASTKVTIYELTITRDTATIEATLTNVSVPFGGITLSWATYGLEFFTAQPVVTVNVRSPAGATVVFAGAPTTTYVQFAMYLVSGNLYTPTAGTVDVNVRGF